MEWRDEGVVLGLKRFGETSVVVEAFTKAHGRHLGLARGGRSARLASVLQPGNTLELVWRARLDEHLGVYQIEPLTQRAARFLSSLQALAGLGWLGQLMRMLAERDPHEALYEALTIILDALDDPNLAPPLIALFEARLLAESGFALDLAECALTGVNDNLVYVSPRTGRAVSASAGEEWRDRLLPLPSFLKSAGGEPPSDQDVADAFRLTGHFLRRELFAPRGLDLPDSRKSFLDAAARGRG